MNKTLLTVALAAFGLAAAGGAMAQQTPERPPVHDRRADADGDQRLSQAEFIARRMERLIVADADRDGSVTRDEMRAAAEARRAGRAEARFDRLDADDDGVISKAEFDERREHRAEGRADHGLAGGRRGPHRRAAVAERMADRGPIVIAQAQAAAEAAFLRLDADRDGYITAADRETGRATRREHRHERRAQRLVARQAQQASPPAPASE